MVEDVYGTSSILQTGPTAVSSAIGIFSLHLTVAEGNV
jgi:hypothetical protein